MLSVEEESACLVFFSSLFLRRSLMTRNWRTFAVYTVLYCLLLLSTLEADEHNHVVGYSRFEALVHACLSPSLVSIKKVNRL